MCTELHSRQEKMLVQLFLSDGSLECVDEDIMEPMPKPKQRNQIFFIVTDHNTNEIKSKPKSNTKTAIVIRIFL